MCGIVGIINENAVNANKRLAYFEQALYTDALRGFDSTGVFTVARNKEVDIFKRAMTAADFMCHSTYEAMITKHNSKKFIVGHNRKATKGGVNHHNAHPFDSGDIVMVHNGTLTNHTTLPDGYKFKVDSQALCHAIHKLGPEEAFSRAEGAFTCVWYNHTEDRLFMLRNEERPMSFAYTSNGVLFASEKMMLLWLADRNDIELKEVHTLPVGTMLSFDVANPHKPQETKIELREPVKSKWYSSGSRAGGNHGKKRGGKTKSTTGATQESNVILLPNQQTTAKERRNASQAKRAKLHKLEIDQDIIIDSVGFEEYNANNIQADPLGKIDGLYSTAYGLALVVECHGIHKSEYHEGAAYEGVLSAIRAANSPDEDVLVVTNAESLHVPIEGLILPHDGDTDEKSDIPFDPDVPANVESSDNNESEEGMSEKKFCLGPSGRYMSRQTFDITTQDGCQYCGGVINPNYADKIGWLDPGHGGGVCCHECYDTYKDMGVFMPVPLH
jgi:hypothetical protein